MKFVDTVSIARMNVLAIFLGVFATLFLSSGFVVNSLLAYKGGYWAWTVALRYLFLLPPLLLVVLAQKRLTPFIKTFRQMPVPFILWGTIGFIFFYTLLVLSANYVPGWLSCAAFQFTIVAGRLISPFIYKDSRRNIAKLPMIMSLLIVGAVIIMQLDSLDGIHGGSSLFWGFILALAASFLWPLGLRKIMLEVENNKVKLSALEISLGMALGAAPAALVLSIVGLINNGLPSFTQVESTLGAAIFAGVIGTALFLKALSMVKTSSLATAAVESTQVTAIWFTLIAEILIKGVSWPGLYANIGFLIVGAVLIGYILMSARSRGELEVSR
ncbi:multidrug resistance efflux transporter family protein [Desertivirga brevis]|uniref:multidrug resistance efflux transporter family protein n=1 Tax=Desertivirga brevis TaxID=2810310 RepID=UPI001A97CEE7|nr:multidrug resistance efflux transporter family protein [Pedobacter sp. SYSU D00873]